MLSAESWCLRDYRAVPASEMIKLHIAADAATVMYKTFYTIKIVKIVLYTVKFSLGVCAIFKYSVQKRNSSNARDKHKTMKAILQR